MLKLGATSASGRRIIMLGLSRMNCDRLLEGKPIHICGEEIGTSTDIMIFAGETEEAMQEELRASGLALPEATRRQRQ
jgi:hypothetical protein